VTGQVGTAHKNVSLIKDNIGERTLLSFNTLDKHPIHYHANVKSLKLWSCKFHWTCHTVCSFT